MSLKQQNTYCDGVETTNQSKKVLVRVTNFSNGPANGSFETSDSNSTRFSVQRTAPPTLSSLFPPTEERLQDRKIIPNPNGYRWIQPALVVQGPRSLFALLLLISLPQRRARPDSNRPTNVGLVPSGVASDDRIGSQERSGEHEERPRLEGEEAWSEDLWRPGRSARCYYCQATGNEGISLFPSLLKL